MPVVKISHVISFSSEDSNFPAENMTRSETFKKWKCKSPGEKQATAILQLEKASVISSIDIGNEYSAFVEVLVGRSGATSDEFQVLLVASSFMSPLEARNGTPANRVRMFSKEHLSKPAVDEKWDQVKIVCTQPFNKGVQYGLSFITIHCPEAQEASTSHTTLGRFTVEEDNEEIPVGSLFAKRKESKEPTLTTAAAIRKASQPSSLGRDDLKTTKTVDKGKKQNETGSTPEAPKKTRAKPTEKEKPRADGTGKRETHKAKTTEIDSKAKAHASKDRAATPDDVRKERPAKRAPGHGSSPPPRKKAKTARRPFGKLLEGIVFVLSGYQNPLRATLRDRAVDMGARYKPDWTAGCTHLICAFPNTPKFQQVRGKGHIVSEKWITECHSQRKRLPWRRFALDRADQNKDESEEEIWEEVSGRVSDDDQDDVRQAAYGRGFESGSGTDEDIERVKLESLRESEAKRAVDEKRVAEAKRAVEKRAVEEERELEAKQAVETREVEDDPYGGDTDVDSDHEGLKENRPDTGNVPLPNLPDFYAGKTFYVHPELDSDTRKSLSRYIIAFKGSVASSMSSDVDYLLAESGTDVETIKTENPKCIAVTPDWVWRCNDAEKLLSTTTYEI